MWYVWKAGGLLCLGDGPRQSRIRFQVLIYICLETVNGMFQRKNNVRECEQGSRSVNAQVTVVPFAMEFEWEGLMDAQSSGGFCVLFLQVNMLHLGFHGLLVGVVVGTEELPEGKLLPFHVLVGRHHLPLPQARV